MKLTTLFRISLLFLPAIVTCTKKSHTADEAFLSFEEPAISLRTYVGWCAANDSLTISKNNSLWIHYASCQDETGVKKQWLTDPRDLEELQEILATGDFGSLDINECGHCADGITYVLTVQDKGKRHRIRLSHSSTTAAQAQEGMAIRLLDKMTDIIERQTQNNH
ncbi:hypothetical protein JHJ32_21705 [Parapedobacter sp. ISTM3]|uniref:hypothetical protein n=1 Tax=Parapedobacter sp. ISTM3 TaxID=2800130 RepID=UPI001906183E|nr:hypothetical protein [Parapedobacter sp. ISTM3]MBK1442631.1 hypothetical protein [Parapedobacter sp. ISTM3]